MKAAAHRQITLYMGSITAMLVAVSVALVAGWGRQAVWRDGAVVRLKSATDAPLPGIASPKDIFAYEVIWEHPLFSPDRLPATTPRPDANSVAPTALALTGTVVTDSGQWALLRDSSSGKNVRLKVGQAYEGVLLVEVSVRSAVLDKQGETITLELRPARAASNDIPTEAHLAVESGASVVDSEAPAPDQKSSTTEHASAMTSGDDAASREAALSALQAQVSERRQRQANEARKQP